MTLQLFSASLVSSVLVPDNLRSAVTKPDRYTPQINETYAEMVAHYQTAVLPARPRKPKDKALVEAAVLLVQRWILARLRHQTFFSLAQLNTAIAELLWSDNQDENRATIRMRELENGGPPSGSHRVIAANSG
jgi:transposase